MGKPNTVSLGNMEVDLHALHAGAQAATGGGRDKLIRSLAQDAEGTLRGMGIPELSADTYKAVQSHAASTLAAQAAAVHIDL